jgi:Toprim domain
MTTLTELKIRLAADPEAVCRAYLPEGRRRGRYWIVGDVQGNRGRSMWVNLYGENRGKWTDAATAEHGDLLDLIRLNKGLSSFHETLEEARHFLAEPVRLQIPSHSFPASHDSPSAARRLFRYGKPVPGTLAETYLRSRAITAMLAWPSLRFHPACYFRDHDKAPLEKWPALISAVSDLSGNLTGVQRTYLDRDGSGKAPFEEPRRSLGHMLGHAVRFGSPKEVMAAGEGIETALSLLSLFPSLPTAAALTVRHLCAMLFPAGLKRLYVLRENDHGGAQAEEYLAGRCREAGIACLMLRSSAKDLNDDLRDQQREVLLKQIGLQLLPEDRERFIPTGFAP